MSPHQQLLAQLALLELQLVPLPQLLATLDITILVQLFVLLALSESLLAQQPLLDQPPLAYLDISYHLPTAILAQETPLHAQLMPLFQLVILVTH